MDDVITVSARNPELDSKMPQTAPEGAFRAYDIRGIYPTEINEEVAYKATKAFIRLAPGKRYLIAYDMRRSSEPLARAIIQAFQEEGAEVDSLGATTTDHLYFVLGKFAYDGGVMITASHNAAKYNGLKFMKSKVTPLDMPVFKDVYDGLQAEYHFLPLAEVAANRVYDLVPEFLQHIKSFSNNATFKPLKVIVDAGNGMAGKIVMPWAAAHPELNVIPMYFEPHADFPHHEANPAVASNISELCERVVAEKADIGVAFDGDGDRVFFVDHEGKPVMGYYVQCLLTEHYLKANKGAAIVYDLRNTRAIETIARIAGGRAVISKAGHTNIKEKMRTEDAIFGGESTSSHFYFRDNFYADSGMVTLEVVLALISAGKNSLQQAVKVYQDRFFASGELNYLLKDRNQLPLLHQTLKNIYPAGSLSEFDGLTIDFPDWRFSLRVSNTEPFIRLNVEAGSAGTLAAKLADMQKVITDFAIFTEGISNINGLPTIFLSKREKLQFLFSNLHYLWNPHSGSYLDELYEGEWSKTQSPIDILRQLDEPKLEAFYTRNRLRIEDSIRLLRTYLESPTPFSELVKTEKTLKNLEFNPIAYFSLEFGLVDWLQTYSGGLGILAGDTMKEASDFGLPIIGIGLFYSQGYFYQRFDQEGWQKEDYLPQDPDDYPVEPVRDKAGNTIIVDVNIGSKIIKIMAWRLKVGRRSLILLDANFNDNPDMLDRMITYHLYGGDQDTRIKQELILAFGGYAILRALDIDPSILHMNEGHSSFVLLARALEYVQTHGKDFDTAIMLARKSLLFTNHTLKAAGNDVFSFELARKYLEPYANQLKTEFRNVFSLGIEEYYAEGSFGMTILGLKNAAKTNAVSKLHAKAAQKIWPNHSMEPVTNGVHLSTWVSRPIHKLLNSYVTEKWNDSDGPVDWKRIENIPDAMLWQAHQSSKADLISELKINCGIEIPQDTLLFGWFRRLTAYKQPEILTLDIDRLAKVVDSQDKPMRFIFGGKAHPNDTMGKELLQKLYKLAQDTKFKNKFVVVPDYNWRMARYMVSGTDVWINSPIRMQEACGTSGMKAGANGVLQLSTLDGWIDEIKDSGVVWEISDSLNAAQYYDQLENVIAPLYYSRNAENIPVEWISWMKQTMKVVLANYGSNRMLLDYLLKLYKPMLEGIVNNAPK